jgi:hypothetical protein
MKPLKLLYIRHSNVVGGENFPIVAALGKRFGHCDTHQIGYGSRWTTFWSILFKLPRLSHYDAIISTEYNIAFAIGLRLLVQRLSARHIVVGLNLSGRAIRTGFVPVDRVFNHIFGRLDGIIVHSREEIDLFRGLHDLSADKFAFSPWGFDLPAEETVSAHFGPGKPAYFCMIGRNNRDFGTFVKAIEASGCRGVIICGSKDQVLRTPHPLIDEFHDLTMDDCIACVRHALANVILVNDADRGAGHITAVMAMLLAKPQIFSSVAVLEDYLTSGEQGIGVKLGDVSAVAAAMAKLQSDADLCRALGNNARARAATHFSHAATSQRTIDLISSFLA